MKNDEMLSFQKLDMESRLGFRSKKFTGVSFMLTFIFGMLMTLIFFMSLYPFKEMHDYVGMFFHGGVQNRSTIPYYTMFLTFWSLAILFDKMQKLKVQRIALRLKILPENHNFILTAVSAKEILANISAKVDSPKHFLLLDRIERSLSNLKNIGNISDVSDGLNAQGSNDENYMHSTYTVLKGFIWAIPVLGFIGTVVGLATAIGGFGNVVREGADVEKLKNSLGDVTGGLGTAFETTLIALVAAMCVHIIMTFVMNREEVFLDECNDYCHKNIIAKLKTANLIDHNGL